MCQVLKCSHAGYYKWRKRKSPVYLSRRRRLLTLIRIKYEESRCTYGYRRIYHALKKDGVNCYLNQIQQLMKENAIFPKRKKKFRHTTDSNHRKKISPNLLKRNFKANALNRVWVGDITYIWTREGWLYLSTVIDLCSKKVVAYSVGNRITKELVIASLKNAIWSRKPKSGLIFHSDQGSQYASDEFREILKQNGLQQSMSRRGDCWDNAVAESFFKTIKYELLYHEQYRKRSTAEIRIFEYIEMFYNTRRLHSSIGYQSPLEFERNLVS